MREKFQDVAKRVDPRLPWQGYVELGTPKLHVALHKPQILRDKPIDF